MNESKCTRGKLQAVQTYSVNSILDRNEDNSVLDLSLKPSKLKTGLSVETVDDNPKVSPAISDGPNTEKINQMFLNLINQRDLPCVNNKRLHPSNIDLIHQARCSYEKSPKLCSASPNLPWNFIRPIHNVPVNGNNIFNQFQNMFNKAQANQSILPGPLYQRINTIKNIFSQHAPINNNENCSNYFHNLSQIFNSRLNVTQNIENSQFISIGAENFNAKHFPATNLDLNSHFNLQNILKSSSNRKRKRTKVTDTRLPRRAATHQSYNSYSQIPDQTVKDLPRFPSFLHSPSNSSQSSHSEEVHGDPKKYTLTPIHLRKAKLMFLYTRYPNSQMLKSYFPDITFSKQNTAQLVKWFSNFREFYYSEMEKAVQRALSNGTQYAKDIDVTVDSELFKNLMTHFNKKKQIVVPCEFLTTVQITLREFFDAISTGKNLHQSWKKPIYKNIAKLDQPLPEFFKDMNWMMELAKDENENISS